MMIRRGGDNTAGPVRSALGRIRANLVGVIAAPDASLADLVGGWRGLADAVGPNLLFLVVYIVTQDIGDAILAALAVCVAIVVARALRRQKTRHAVAGTVLVGVSGLLVAITGQSADFFLPELIQTGAVSAILLLSLAVRRPLMGYLLGPMLPGTDWRTDRVQLRAYGWATAVWAAAAAVRTLAKLPFYVSGDVVALGIVDLLTGLPLAALMFYLQIRVLRRAYVRSLPAFYLSSRHSAASAGTALQHQR